MARNKKIVDYGHGIYFGANSAALIEIKKEDIEPDAVNNYQTAPKKWALWGAMNDRPQKIVDENMQDGASAGALRFKINAHYGGDLIWYKKVKEGKKVILDLLEEEDLSDLYDQGEEIQEFAFNNDLPNLQQKIITDFEWWNFYYLQYIINKGKTKIVQVDWKRVIDTRVGIRDKKTGDIPFYYLSGKWPSPPENEVVPLPVFDKKDPFKYPNAVYRHMLVSVDKDYYPMPYWQSNMKWLAVAQKIPDWINSNIENALNIKYHIQIPESYFTQLTPRELYDSDEKYHEAVAAKKQEVLQKMDDFLAGQKNASKSFFSFFALDDMGKEMPGWKIEPISNEIKDEAWLKAYGTAAAAICTAHGVPPSLQGLILQSGLGAGSASDTREQFNYYMQLNTVIPRQTTLEWYYLVRRINKWPKDLHLGYKEIVLQTIDKNKSGVDRTAKPDPTTDNA